MEPVAPVASVHPWIQGWRIHRRPRVKDGEPVPPRVAELPSSVLTPADSRRPALEPLDALEDEPLGGAEAGGDLAEARRVGAEHGLVDMVHLAHRRVQLVDGPCRQE